MKLTNIGAGWKRTAKSGKKYLSLALSRDFKQVPEADWNKLSLFENQFKKLPKQPDFILTAPIEGGDGK